MNEASIIEEVKESEERAKEAVEHANFAKQRALSDAHGRAAKITESANQKAKEIREGAIAKSQAEAEMLKKKMLSDAEKKAAKARKTKASATAVRSAANELVRVIIGE